MQYNYEQMKKLIPPLLYTGQWAREYHAALLTATAKRTCSAVLPSGAQGGLDVSVDVTDWCQMACLPITQLRKVYP